MRNVLLVEPAYRSKFPPLGLMRISTLHKGKGDAVTFARGKVRALRELPWHRVYVSSLFTYDLPRTVDTLEYYRPTVQRPEDLVVGGIAATLMPEYISSRVRCRVLPGLLDKPGLLEPNSPPVDLLVPDYQMLTSVDKSYSPRDAYFCRATKGCVRRCRFCAVPRLEPVFGSRGSIGQEVTSVTARFGPRRDLVLMDNNVLAAVDLPRVVDEICDVGFRSQAALDGRKRHVDFNQGIDARLVTPDVAKLLARTCMSPVRLAFDDLSVENAYRKAVQLLAGCGFEQFTNYVMFNFEDDPMSFHHRLRVNVELSRRLSVRVTSFPMKYVPIDDITRGNVGRHWHWRYLRGIQCILVATHGLVSPNPEFVAASFGETLDEFLEIVSMPDRYIIYRREHLRQATEWRKLFRRLSPGSRHRFLDLLDQLRDPARRSNLLPRRGVYRALVEHYYPTTPPGETGGPQQQSLW
jgi:hypothetical protein